MPELYGVGLWAETRTAVLEGALDATGARQHLSGWARRPPGEPAQVLLTALVILADWLASNTDLFPYTSCDCADERAELAWAQLGLPACWSPAAPDVTLPSFWASRFSLPAGAVARPVQTQAGLLVHEAVDPRLLVVEAPMGVLPAADTSRRRRGDPPRGLRG